jgi:outer membrane murein-binding lipoprotein Lpp
VSSHSRPNRRFALATAIIAVAAGCSSRPNQANIVLRKQNQDLSSQVSDLQRQNAALIAQEQATDAHSSSISPQLPESRLQKLFTAAGLKIGSLTGGYNPGPSGPDTELRVFVVPTDQDGQPIKMAGSFSVELFDLSEQDTRIGRWDFPTDQSRAAWFGQAMLYTYMLECPWQTPPQHVNLTMKVTFTDELTGRRFAVTQPVTVNPPMATSSLDPRTDTNGHE